eukprot:SAG31_NODE_1317_length_8836_cov_3.151311_4_plen_171_part_00
MAPAGGQAEHRADRMEALFADAIAAGWVSERDASGMARGLSARIEAGKLTEGAAAAEVAKKLEKMKAVFEKRNAKGKAAAEKAKNQKVAAKENQGTPESHLAQLTGEQVSISQNISVHLRTSQYNISKYLKTFQGESGKQARATALKAIDTSCKKLKPVRWQTPSPVTSV